VRLCVHFYVHDSWSRISNPKQPNCKKSVWPPRRPLWKKDVKSKVAAKKWLDGRLIAKILIMTIQVNLCCLLHVSLGFDTKFTWIVVIKIFAISLPSNHFLAAYFDFTSFFTKAFLGATHFFTVGLFWIRFHFFLQLHILCITSILPSLIKCLLLSIFLPLAELCTG